MRLLAGIDLHVTGKRSGLRGKFFCQRAGEFLPVHGFNNVKKRNGVFHLVGLKRPDQVQFNVGKFRP